MECIDKVSTYQYSQLLCMQFILHYGFCTPLINILIICYLFFDFKVFKVGHVHFTTSNIIQMHGVHISVVHVNGLRFTLCLNVW
jgi:hypothetical protein